jgi:hypothetical protein
LGTRLREQKKKQKRAQTLVYLFILFVYISI